jgi:hypothetical protein
LEQNLKLLFGLSVFRFGGFPLPSLNASADVLRTGDGLKVRGIHASPIPAQMVELQSFRDVTDFALVDVSVSQCDDTVVGDSAVPGRLNSARPLPASGIGVDRVGNGFVSPVDVPHDESDGLAAYMTVVAVGASGQIGSLATAALAQTGRVWPVVGGVVQPFGVTANESGRLSEDDTPFRNVGLGNRGSFAATALAKTRRIRHKIGTLSSRHWIDLLNRSMRCAVPRSVSALPGFSLPELYQART